MRSVHRRKQAVLGDFSQKFYPAPALQAGADLPF